MILSEISLTLILRRQCVATLDKDDENVLVIVASRPPPSFSPCRMSYVSASRPEVSLGTISNNMTRLEPKMVITNFDTICTTKHHRFLI